MTSCPAARSSPTLREHLGVLATGDEREPFDVAVRLRRELDDRADQRGRQVVDDEPAEVLEHVGHARPTGARQAGDQDDVSHGRTLPTRRRPGPAMAHRSCVRCQAPTHGLDGQVRRRRRYSRRGIVDAAAYSAARSRKPCGGAGSTIRSSTRPASPSALTYVDSGRWMNRMNTPCSTCSTESCSTRYGPIRQYGSGGSRVWSLIQPLPGRLQQRVVEEEAEAAAGAQRPGRSRRSRRATSSMCSNTRHATAASNDPSANGSSAAPARTYAGPPAALGCDRDLVPRRVDADDVDTGGRQQPADLTVAAADVEHPVESGRVPLAPAAGSALRTRGRRRR